MAIVVIKIVMIVVVYGAMRIKDAVHNIRKNIREKVDYNH